MARHPFAVSLQLCCAQLPLFWMASACPTWVCFEHSSPKESVPRVNALSSGKTLTGQPGLGLDSQRADLRPVAPGCRIFSTRKGKLSSRALWPLRWGVPTHRWWTRMGCPTDVETPDPNPTEANTLPALAFRQLCLFEQSCTSLCDVLHIALFPQARQISSSLSRKIEVNMSTPAVSRYYQPERSAVLHNISREHSFSCLQLTAVVAILSFKKRTSHVYIHGEL